MQCYKLIYMILAIDEVGRGCLAGPMVIGAVILDKSIAGLKDSKLLTRLQRERLDLVIRAQARVFALGWVSALEIDQLGLTSAETLAIKRAINQIECEYDEIVIDGNYNFLPDNPIVKTMICADKLVPAVSAASIIAKVARDNYMKERAIDFPNYGFEKHVGYCTRLHLDKIKKFGICELHRRSFAPIKQMELA